VTPGNTAFVRVRKVADGNPRAPIAGFGFSRIKLEAGATPSTYSQEANFAQATETSPGFAKVATQALTNAGTDDTTFVTPKKLRAGFAISFTANGYIAFPTWLGGLIIQWGNIVTGAGGLVQAAFPIAFPTSCICALVNYIASGNSLGSAATVSSNTTRSIIQANCFTTSTGAGFSGGAIYYLAIGF
jgi:hypothetical protein